MYEPPQVCEELNARLYSNRKIITNRPTLNNINERITYEKINKLLADEIKTMYKVVIVPIVIGTIGKIPSKLHVSLITLNLKKNLYPPIKKLVLLDT